MNTRASKTTQNFKRINTSDMKSDRKRKWFWYSFKTNGQCVHFNQLKTQRYISNLIALKMNHW